MPAIAIPVWSQTAVWADQIATANQVSGRLPMPLTLQKDDELVMAFTIRAEREFVDILSSSNL
ncbi:hypothetical protein QZJ86_03345 [Methylomonas montana]|uniref:hypothetical protein n=1 Tax=Methylomonas montana TaxID=3058963 RepID=UPI0026589826|nr:hypothetical protein [Methylomonas montana]WKJ91176.1 hypothetical protein QZJ86_03345 [Methylomonas montana]